MVAHPLFGSGSEMGVMFWSGSSKGSGSGPGPDHCRFCPEGQLLPVELTLRLDYPVEGGDDTGCANLNRPTTLIHSQDPRFACSWFSRSIDLGEDTATWVLEKTAIDRWQLCLRQIGGELAAYDASSDDCRFPLTLKKAYTTEDFRWPATITIRAGAND
jgi:hypothetical protein